MKLTTLSNKDIYFWSHFYGLQKDEGTFGIPFYFVIENGKWQGGISLGLYTVKGDGLGGIMLMEQWNHLWN